MVRKGRTSIVLRELIPFNKPKFLALARPFYGQLFSAFPHQLPRVFNHDIDFCVVMVGIVMEKQKLADFGIERERHSGSDRTMTPADVVLVLFVGVLRVENQNIAAVKKLNEIGLLIYRSLFCFLRSHVIALGGVQKFVGLVVGQERD